MKLWLDDQIDDKETPARWVPDGWVGAKTALAACRLIDRGSWDPISFDHDLVDHISFDHDLGSGFSGYVVARFIEKRAFAGVRPPSYDIHSANPVGAKNIERAMESAWALYLRFEMAKNRPAD